MGWYRSKFNHTLSGIPGMPVRYTTPVSSSAIPDITKAVAVSLTTSGLLLHPALGHSCSKDLLASFIHISFCLCLFQLGISNDTHIVVYDNNPKFGFYSAGRVWWMFKVHFTITYIYMCTSMIFECAYIHVSSWLESILYLPVCILICFASCNHTLLLLVQFFPKIYMIYHFAVLWSWKSVHPWWWSAQVDWGGLPHCVWSPAGGTHLHIQGKLPSWALQNTRTNDGEPFHQKGAGTCMHMNVHVDLHIASPCVIVIIGILCSNFLEKIVHEGYFSQVLWKFLLCVASDKIRIQLLE